MSKFQLQDEIRFRYTGDKGTIIEDNLDGSYNVMLFDGDEILAFADDIVLAKDFKQLEESAYMKKHKKEQKLTTEDLFFSKEDREKRKKDELLAPLVKNNLATAPKAAPKKKEVEEEPVSTFVAQTIQKTAPTHRGLFVALVQDGELHYTIYLVNDSQNSIGYQTALYLDDEVVDSENRTIPPFSYEVVGELLHYQFNDNPRLDVICKSISFEKSLRLKYKSLAKSYAAVPLMGVQGYVFLLFEKHNPYKASTLQEYTRQQIGVSKNEEDAKERARQQTELLKERAYFDNVLDLHIEMLTPDFRAMKPQEIVALQMEELELFLKKAAKLGVEEVFVIHGVGEGKLKQYVADYLRRHALVRTFRNEHHPRYGFGATEVFLKKDKLQ